MIFIDMFCGMGTARIAFEQAGHTCVYSIEYDKHKRKIYEVVTGNEPEGGDIRAVRADELPKADCWIAGFPCTDISVAGKQLGFRGERSSLFFEVMRLLRETQEENKPSYLLFENVKNFFSVSNGRDFLEALYQMDAHGYNAEWALLNSKHYGVPQNRERVFIVGHLRGRCTRKVFPVTGTNGKTIIETVSGSQRFRVYDPKGISPCIHTCPDGGTEVKIKVVGRINSSQDGLVFDTTGISQCLSAGHGNMPKIEVRAVLTPGRSEKRQNGRRMKEDGEPMFTLTGQDRHGIQLQNRIRRLTPREVFRLQAVPEYIIDKILSSGISDSQMYRAAGDAMTVSVIRAIASNMEV